MKILLLFFFWSAAIQGAVVELGVDRFVSQGHVQELKGKRVGLITNQTGINSALVSTVDLLLQQAPDIKLVALFSPEHGIRGQVHAEGEILSEKDRRGIPIYSLYGKLRRPSAEMLKGIDVLIYDIQDIGVRSYTYATTLFYTMEEAAKRGIQVIVFDRPNPINGLTVDGPMMEDKWRSFIGYLNIPYCHGMTTGELANYFNETGHIGCSLKVIPMKGWKREMSYKDTGLPWVPTSPHIPEADTALFYASTGILGELGIVNIGVGYTLPFKIVGAPWIKAEEFAQQLNSQKLPGVTFLPFFYRPFYGTYKGKDCQGVMIVITKPEEYRPLSVQYMFLGLLKTMYPTEMRAQLKAITRHQKEMFCKANGNEEMFSLLCREKYVAWKLIRYQSEERSAFLDQRKRYLLY